MNHSIVKSRCNASTCKSGFGGHTYVWKSLTVQLSFNLDLNFELMKHTYNRRDAMQRGLHSSSFFLQLNAEEYLKTFLWSKNNMAIVG